MRALAAALAAALVAAGPAAAHVTLTPPSATPGRTATLSFRVPNERRDASTVRVEVFLPEGGAVGTVRVPPHAGWRSARQADPAAEVDWGAGPGAEIGPGEAATFTIEAGPLPHAERLVFKTLQHYSDGEVVRWIQEPTPGEDAPPRPAPTLRLAAADAPAAEAGGGAARWPVAAALGALALVAAAGLAALRRRQPGKR